MINFQNLIKVDKPRCKVGIIGSNGSFGYTFLSQIILMEETLKLRVVCDLDIEQSVSILISLGYDAQKLFPCKKKEEIFTVPEDAILILDDASLVPNTDIDVMVEATGQPEGSAINAERCILKKKHVTMVSKEADVIAGPYLFNLSKKYGVTYSITIGDQPANLINWISYIRALGMDIICAGKSSEYDFIYDLDTGRFQYRKQEDNIPDLKKYWNINDLNTTLQERSKLLYKYPQFAIPDYNEMNIVSNATGLFPSCPRLHYPIINVTELADVYSLKEDGGLIEKPGVLDSFNCLHRFDEVSFAGGVFVVVRSHNDKQTEILASKGHVVSKNKKYLALFLPYHYMGMEAPMSVLQSYYLNISSYNSYRYVSTMVCKTEREFKKGEVLSLHSHHRCISDVYVAFEPQRKLEADVAPYYLIAEKRVLRDIPKGTIIRKDMVDLSTSALERMLEASICM